MDFNALINCKRIVECKFCGWKGKPWEQLTVYECTDWSKPKGKRFKYVKVYCPKCKVLEPFIYYNEK